MKSRINRRSLGVLVALLASQLLSACIIVPRPYIPRVVIVEPGYPGSPHPEYRGRRDGYRP